jgi:hypothetical protein
MRYEKLSTMIFAVALAVALATGGKSSAAVSRSCGTVSESAHVTWRVTITKGSPSCSTVRAIAKRYGHPKAVRFYCPQKNHICEYRVYPEGWRCTGQFQGGYGCWLGGDARGKNARASFSGVWVY